MSKVANLLLRFVFLIALQVIILNNVGFNGYISPYFYVLFVILLPFETPKWLSLFLGFLLGFFVDLFSQTIGMHIAATLFMVYIRQLLLNFLAPKDGYEFGLKPNVKQMGITWFVFYSAVLVFSHHLFLFLVEAFSFQEIFSTLLRAILSTIFTLVLVFISQLLVYSKK